MRAAVVESRPPALLRVVAEGYVNYLMMSR